MAVPLLRLAECVCYRPRFTVTSLRSRCARWTLTLMKVTSALLSFVCFAVIGTGVAARQAAPRGGGAPVVSPEVSADGKVTFRLRAAGATEVAVIGLSSPLSMTRDDQGVWSATTPSLTVRASPTPAMSRTLSWERRAVQRRAPS